MRYAEDLVAVGKHLETEAKRQPALSAVLVRSSVSRYYYALFWTVQAIIRAVGAEDPEPATPLYRRCLLRVCRVRMPTRQIAMHCDYTR